MTTRQPHPSTPSRLRPPFRLPTRSLTALAIALLAASPGLGQIASTAKSIDGFSFQIADGWELEKIAIPELVKWPIAATWDPSGNLVIAESAGVKQSVQEQLQSLPHRLVRLIDENRDGTYDKRQIVAEQLAFPEGVLCLGNDILVSAPPQIWRLIDSDGDGVCERREVWHDGKTLTGCANDLHGPFVGPEGWIYWCKAAFAEQSFPIAGPFPAKSTASHLYRRQIDAPKSDRIMTGGMDNLVDIAFDDLGDKFFVSTFLHHPGNGLRDGIGHAVYGAVFGKDHAVLRGHPRTGPLMKPLVELGPAAPAGLLAVTDDWSDELPPYAKARNTTATASRDASLANLPPTTLIAAQFNLQRISMHRLIRDGASYRSKDADLLVCDQLDFHPVDVLQDVDGSLIVIDTGGWYDLCCPSSGTEERVATGGIYRLRHVRTSRNYHDRWSQVQQRVQEGRWRELLRDPQRRVRELGTEHWLNAGFDAAVDSSEHAELQWLHDLMNDPREPIAHRASAFWALAKWIERFQKTEQAPGFVIRALAKEADPLCESALHLASTYRWPEIAPRLRELARSLGSPMVRRLAAEALGRIGDAESLPSLFDSWSVADSVQTDTGAGSPSDSGQDRMLEHAILFAILEIAQGDEQRTNGVEVLRSVWSDPMSSPSLQFAALHVLRERGLEPGDAIDPALAERLIASIDSPHERLAQTAQEILASNSELMAVFIKRLNSMSESQLQESSPAILRVLSKAYTQPLVLSWVQQRVLHADQLTPWRIGLFEKLLAQYRNQSLPAEWADGLAKWVQTDSEMSTRLLTLLQAVKVPAASEKLVQALHTRLSETDLPGSALAIGAMPEGAADVPDALQQAIVNGAIQPENGDQQLVWNAISKLELNEASWKVLARSLPSLPPAAFSKGLEKLATSRASHSPEVGMELLRSMETIPTTKTLARESVEKWFAGHPASTREKLRDSLDRLFAPPLEIQSTIDAALTSLPKGEAHRGQDVYRSSKAACSACHRIGYVGGNIGPELTRIGRSRTQRDLMESILFPSHRIAQGFASANILTSDEEVISGLVAYEDDRRIELIVSADKRVSIDKSAIEKRSASAVSLMPAGIDKLLSPQELADLLAFLEQSR
ncbi:DUF7133 domain-containing protein [Pirellulaceae bacterium SH467]